MLTRDFTRDDAVPYFLWDRDVTVAEFRERLDSPTVAERDAMLALLLREARPDEVWEFVSPERVANDLPRIAPRLGRQRAFWDWLVAEWRRLGLLSG